MNNSTIYIYIYIITKKVDYVMELIYRDVEVLGGGAVEEPHNCAEGEVEGEGEGYGLLIIGPDHDELVHTSIIHTSINSDQFQLWMHKTLC
jgi:hypothetical protein